MKSGLSFSIILFLLIPALQAEEKEVLLGQPADISCTYPGDLKGKAMVVSLTYTVGGKTTNGRIAFVRHETGFSSVPSEATTYLDTIKDLAVHSSGKTGVSLKSAKMPREVDGIIFKCAVFGNSGLGVEVWKKEISIKVIDPPKVNLEPADAVIRRAKDSKEDVVVKCNATGTPKPTLKWMRQEEEVPSTTGKDGILQMTLKAPITVKQDGDYDCVAQVKSELLKTKGLAEARKTVRLSVLYKPTLTIDKGTIYTDLDRRETLKINVSGNPQPRLNCSMLQLPEPKLIRLTPTTHHTFVYEVTILKVTERDIREYECKAWNDEGVAKDVIRLTLEPSEPEILSSNSSTYSDYYLLHWSVKSIAPMQNVTVEVRVRTENSTKLLRTDTFKLAPGAPSYRNHIANLTDNTVHELRLRACNSRACGKQKVVHAFRTLQYDGTNTVDPTFVKVPVTMATIRRGKNTQGQGNAATVHVLSWAVISASALLTFIH